MVPGARAALAVLGLVCCPAGPLRAEAERVHGCMPPGRAREVLIAERFVAPFRALNVAAASQSGDPVGLQLCLFGDAFVYDVTLLRRDGRVSHTLVDAHSGAILGGPKAAK
jgi:hypothetical protein